VKTLLLLSCLWSLCAAPDDALSNGAILELVRAGMTDSSIVQLIEIRTSAFDVSVQALIALKQSGVSPAVIKSMLAASARPQAGTDGLLRSPLPDEQGVYWEAEQGLQPLPVENITLRGPRGFETDTGVLSGISSMVALTPPLTFVIRTPDGMAADDYLLVQMFVRKDRREFRTLMGSLWRGDGIERMAVPFESARVAPNVYRVSVVALPKGEFGFIRPGTQLPTAIAASRPEGPEGLAVPAVPGTTVLPTTASAGAMFTFSVR
jgi:hypothetical protein